MISWKIYMDLMKSCFGTIDFEGTNDNILVFWLYVNLIDICNMKPKLLLSLLMGLVFNNCGIANNIIFQACRCQCPKLDRSMAKD